MGADERLPRVAPLPRRGRIDTLLLEDTLDRVPPQFVAYVLERSTQSRIAPTRVLPSHPHQQADDAGHAARSPRPAFGAAIVLLRHQFAVPTQDRIWRRHRGNLTKSPASELPPQHRARFQPREISHSHLARVSAQDGIRPSGLRLRRRLVAQRRAKRPRRPKRTAALSRLRIAQFSFSVTILVSLPLRSMTSAVAFPSSTDGVTLTAR